MTLQKVSPGLLPAENYRRFNAAFDAIDAALAALQPLQGLPTQIPDAYNRAIDTALRPLRDLPAQTVDARDRAINAQARVAEMRAALVAAQDRLVATGSALADTASDLVGTDARVASTEAVQARLPARRPGDLPSSYTNTTTGGRPEDLARLDASLVALSDAGFVARLVGPGIVAERNYTAIEGGRTTLFAFGVQRRANPVDPLGDAVRLMVCWYSAAYIPVGSPSVVADLSLLVSAGRTFTTRRVARAAGPGIDLVPPAGAAYMKAAVQVFGGNPVTDIEVLGHADITDATAWSPDVTSLQSQVDGFLSLNAGSRIQALESAVGNPLSRTFQTINDAAAATIPSAITIVQTLGVEAAGVGGAHTFARAPSAPTSGFYFKSADGQWWLDVEETVSISKFMRATYSGDWGKALTSAINSGFRAIEMVAGQTYPTKTAITLRDEIKLFTRGRRAFIQLAAGTTLAAILTATNVSGWAVENIDIDGNLAQQSAGTVGFDVQGCSGFRIKNLRVKDCKADGYNLGWGVRFIDCKADAGGRRNLAEGIDVSGCQNVGIFIERCTGLDLISPAATGAAFAGIAISDPNTPANELRNGLISIVAPRCSGNGVGLSIQGFGEVTTSLGRLPVPNNIVNRRISVLGGLFYDNVVYGLIAQGRELLIANPNVFGNGSDNTNGGLLFNCLNSKLTGALIHGNHGCYGLDAGGSQNCEIDAQVFDNGLGTTFSCIGVNLGSVINTRFDGSVSRNGGSARSFQILASALDGLGGPTEWFPWIGTNLRLGRISIETGSANQVPVKVCNGWRGVSIERIEITDKYGSFPNEIIVPGDRCELGEIIIWDANLNKDITLASAYDLVVPDHARKVRVTGSAPIARIWSATQFAYAFKVSEVDLPSGAINGATGAPQVVFGGGGSGATLPVAVPAVGANGQVIGIYMTSNGSGITAPVTATLQGAGIPPTTLSAIRGCDNVAGTDLDMEFSAVSSISIGNSGAGGDGSFWSEKPAPQTSAFGLSRIGVTRRYGQSFETYRSMAA